MPKNARCKIGYLALWIIDTGDIRWKVTVNNMRQKGELNVQVYNTDI